MLKPLEVLQLYPEHDYTLNGAFASRAQRDPRRPFMLFAGRTWSWAEFGAAAEQAARLFLARGVRRTGGEPVVHPARRGATRRAAAGRPCGPRAGVRAAGRRAG